MGLLASCGMFCRPVYGRLYSCLPSIPEILAKRRQDRQCMKVAKQRAHSKDPIQFTDGLPFYLPIILINFSFAPLEGYGWFGVIRRYVNSNGFPLGFALSPFGSTVTNTASICDRVLPSLDLRTQRCLLISS